MAAEFIKYIPGEGSRELIDVIKELWRGEEIIESWRTAIIYPIYKKGDENEAKNYRGISLLDLGYKILAAVMSRRLNTWLEKEKKLNEAQAGFRTGRSTMEQIFVLNSLIGNRLKKKGGKLYTAFIDYKAAFDKVNREILWTKMEKMGIRGKFLRTTKLIYKLTENRVIAGDRLTEKFDTGKGVRQGCPLSPTLFNIYIDDLETEFRKAGNGGSVIGTGKGTKIYALLYADDAAIVAETAKELEKMLVTLEKWSDKNKMEVSTEKTKVMIFTKPGRRRKESWRYKGTDLEVVSEFKYLGFWFTTANSYTLHTRKAAGKTQQMINKVWGETRRAKVDDLRRRLYFMDATVQAAALYGAEIWGWERKETIERVQNRMVKASLGVAINTPDYIWKLEAGRRSIELEALKRASDFLLRIQQLEETSWPRRCLNEELRGLKNNDPTAWAKKLQKRLRAAGDETLIDMFRDSNCDREQLMTKLSEMRGKLEDQDIQKDWTRVERSSFCSYYGELKKDTERAGYWQSKQIPAWQKEEWARWRCGNVVKEAKKGYQNDRCRGCREEQETLEHVVSCKAITERLNKKDSDWWKKWRGNKKGAQLRNKIINKLANKLDSEMCSKMKRINDALRGFDKPEEAANEAMQTKART